MPEQQPQVLQVNSQFLALTVAMIDYDEETFRLICGTGVQGLCYVLTPKHAKRLQMLLSQKLVEYESKFGELKTQLPPATTSETQRNIGFAPEEKK